MFKEIKNYYFCLVRNYIILVFNLKGFILILFGDFGKIDF